MKKNFLENQVYINYNIGIESNSLYMEYVVI